MQPFMSLKGKSVGQFKGKQASANVFKFKYYWYFDTYKTLLFIFLR